MSIDGPLYIKVASNQNILTIILTVPKENYFGHVTIFVRRIDCSTKDDQTL